MERLNSTELNQVKEDTTQTTSLEEERKQSKLSIVEYQALSKKTICSDRSHSCLKDTRKQKLLKTSAQALTSKEKGLKPFWNEQCQAINSKLWLPTGIDFQGLDSTLSNGLSKEAVEKSWFSSKIHFRQNKNLPKTFLASCMSSRVDCTDLEIIKSKSIRIFLSPEQKQILKGWEGTARYIHNQVIEKMLGSEGKLSWMDIKKEFTRTMPDWSKKTPFQIKGIAIKEAHSSVIKSLTHAKKTGKPARISFRSKKQSTKSLYIPKTAVNDNGVYVRVLGKITFAEALPDNPLDSRLVYEYGNWYLNVPYKSKITLSENQGRMVALDPGVRSFMTFFSEDSCGYFGYDDFGCIQRLTYYLDNLISRASKATGKKKREMRKAQMRMRRRIKNLINEMHWKTANFLINNFDVIFLPTFETSKMALRAGRKLKSKSVRAMLTWSHYTFKQRLKHKAKEFGKEVIDVTEEYTSKTVSWTGEVKNVGGSRVIKSGGISLDRDLNGARNIFIKSLVDTPTVYSAVVNVC